MEKEYYSTSQLAKKLNITRQAVYKKVKKGQIKAIKVGRSYAIPKEYAKKYLFGKNGYVLNEEEKTKIELVVKEVFDEYGDVLRKLGSE